MILCAGMHDGLMGVVSSVHTTVSLMSVMREVSIASELLSGTVSACGSAGNRWHSVCHGNKSASEPANRSCFPP